MAGRTKPLKQGRREPSERQFQAAVVQLAKVKGWRVYFTWRPIHSPAGYPDLFMVRRDRVIWAELKTSKGKTTPMQDDWLADLGYFAAAVNKPVDEQAHDFDHHVLVRIWRPSDFEEIVRALQ